MAEYFKGISYSFKMFRHCFFYANEYMLNIQYIKHLFSSTHTNVDTHAH